MEMRVFVYFNLHKKVFSVKVLDGDLDAFIEASLKQGV